MTADQPDSTPARAPIDAAPATSAETAKMAALTSWTARVAQELDLEAALEPEAIDEILRLAGLAAHGVVRPAGPVATFMAGYLLARAGTTDSRELSRIAADIVDRIDRD